MKKKKKYFQFCHINPVSNCQDGNFYYKKFLVKFKITNYVNVVNIENS